MIHAVNPADLIEHYGQGSIAKAAPAMQVTRQTLYNWQAAGKVPLLWQVWFERDTAGRLKADVGTILEARARA